MASLKDFQFGNGTIEYDVSADNGMGAAFMFRAASKENFEMFYLRPRPNCQEAPDCVQYAPQSTWCSAVGCLPAISGAGSASFRAMEPCETRDLGQAHEHLLQWGGPAYVESQPPRGRYGPRRPDVGRARSSLLT